MGSHCRWVLKEKIVPLKGLFRCQALFRVLARSARVPLQGVPPLGTSMVGKRVEMVTRSGRRAGRVVYGK